MNITFPSCPKPLILSQAKGIDMKTTIYSHANTTHFQKKRFYTKSLVLKVRILGTQNWPIHLQHTRMTETITR